MKTHELQSKLSHFGVDTEFGQRMNTHLYLYSRSTGFIVGRIATQDFFDVHFNSDAGRDIDIVRNKDSILQVIIEYISTPVDEREYTLENKQQKNC